MGKLDDAMNFDHVIEISQTGEIIERSDVYAPDLHDGELSDKNWELMDGYSGQSGYSGPIMHQSEFVGGGLEIDILGTPGLYVTVVDYPLDDTEPEGWAVARRDT